MGSAGSDYRWVVDPLDGTTNYSQGLPVFSVSIALQYRGETIAGVVYAPYLNGAILGVERRRGLYEEPFRRGEAAASLRQADPRHVGPRHRISVRQGCQSGQQQRQRRADHPHVRDVRRLGSAAYDLSCIAAGLLDGYWELDLHEWDVCAANLIVREAGGVVTDFRPDRGVSQAAGNEALVREILKYII